MFKSLRVRIIVILLVLTGSGVYLYQNQIKLGLDLQGEMYLALEVVIGVAGLFMLKRLPATTQA